MRYTFDIDRPAEPDGVDIDSPNGDNSGLGAGSHYSYVSVFDGTRGAIRWSSFLQSPPPARLGVAYNVDAQNLDLRPLMLAFRSLDSVMGMQLIDRAVTNQRRFYYKGRSTHLLEERHDPSTWKAIVWLEPERDFLVSKFALNFAQQRMVELDIDYQRDPQWGWIPIGWRISGLLADGSRRLLTTARVTSYSINTPMDMAMPR